jgi:hypothetical protein
MGKPDQFGKDIFAEEGRGLPEGGLLSPPSLVFLLFHQRPQHQPPSKRREPLPHQNLIAGSMKPTVAGIVPGEAAPGEDLSGAFLSAQPTVPRAKTPKPRNNVPAINPPVLAGLVFRHGLEPSKTLPWSGVSRHVSQSACSVFGRLWART